MPSLMREPEPQIALVGMEFHQWSEDPQTRRFCQFLRQEVERYQEEWLQGGFPTEINNQRAQAGAYAMAALLGQIENIQIGEGNESKE